MQNSPDLVARIALGLGYFFVPEKEGCQDG